MNRIKIIAFLISFLELLCFDLTAQKNKWDHEIGTNLLQIPTTTIDINYRLSVSPWYSLIINTGYTFNYIYNFDIIGFFLSPHCKCANHGYSIKNQSGPYLKIGILYNFRQNESKDNYFFIGGLLNNSLACEQAIYNDPNTIIEESDKVEHTQFVYGFIAWTGYNFKIKGKLCSDFGLQISFPSKGYNSLYGDERYSPGFGYMEPESKIVIIPMVVFSLKYKLKASNNNSS